MCLCPPRAVPAGRALAATAGAGDSRAEALAGVAAAASNAGLLFAAVALKKTASHLNNHAGAAMNVDRLAWKHQAIHRRVTRTRRLPRNVYRVQTAPTILPQRQYARAKLPA